MPQVRAKEPGYPCLKAKAAETRRAIAFAYVLAQLHARGDVERPPLSFRSHMAARSADYRRLVLDCVGGAHEFNLSIDREPFVAEDCARSMMSCLLALKDLHDLWRRGLPLGQHAKQPWHVQPKCHQVDHMVHHQLQRYGSPKQFWCYGDESFMGAAKSIAASSRHPRTLEATVLRKAALAAGIAARGA